MASETKDPERISTESGLRVVGSEPRNRDEEPLPSTSRRTPTVKYGEGDVIAEKYRLKRKLGEGGMGEVWLAYNETLEIDVAVKLIRGDVANPEMADRLLQEARAAARLGHPAIVRVNDFGRTNRDDPFIVMEVLEGEDLATTLAKRGRLSAVKSIRTLLPIAHALTAAHNKGIVHRDLKPENVFLARSDAGQIQPKLVDFGVAKLEKSHSHRVTQTGSLLGSPQYMSPEQARGDDVDHRADIWAFAVVLYETMTGRAPFDGKNYNAVLYAITANSPTPLTELDAGDAELWTILERGFQKDPDRRWYSIRDFGEALARWLEDNDVHEDITGASLQSQWLQWKKEDDQLGTGSSIPPGPNDNEPLTLPPLPQLPHDTSEPVPSRERQITIRKLRPARNLPLFVAVGVAALLIGVLAVVLIRSREAPVTGIALAPTTTPVTEDTTQATGSPVQPAAAPEAPDDPAHERAVEEALAAATPDPETAPSAAPPHVTSAARHVHHPAVDSAPLRSAPPGGIYTKDPYATPVQHHVR